MDIKDLLGDEYKDGMTIEEINAVLANKKFVDPATLPKSVEKTVFDKTASELSKAKKELEELKSASLTADEKLQKALEKAEAERVSFARKSTRLEVEKVFVDGGLAEGDYKDFIDGLIGEDTTASVTMAKSIMSVISAQKVATEKSVKAELLKGNHRPPAGKGTEGMTLENLRKMSPADRLKFAQDNPEEYKELYGGNQ